MLKLVLVVTIVSYAYGQFGKMSPEREKFAANLAKHAPKGKMPSMDELNKMMDKAQLKSDMQQKMGQFCKGELTDKEVKDMDDFLRERACVDEEMDKVSHAKIYCSFINQMRLCIRNQILFDGVFAWSKLKPSMVKISLFLKTSKNCANGVHI